MSWQLTRFSEAYAINHRAQTPCVLIAGWSCRSDIFEWLWPGLAQHFVVYSADADQLPADINQWADELAASLQQQLGRPALLIGWSLGGNLALALAARHPQQVAGLCLMASNPCFVADDDWPGIAAAQLAAFQQGIAADSDKTLRRFDLLQSQGDVAQAPLRRALADYRARQRDWTAADLQQGLALLASVDQRAQLASLAMPVLCCLGRHDRLVPAALADALAAQSPQVRVELLEDSAHLPFLSQPDACFAALLGHFDSAADRREKQRIASAFSAAATGYDKAAGLQQWTAGELLRRCPPLAGRQVLDAGCGTGQWTARLADAGARVIGLDLAAGMLQFARAHHAGAQAWLVADSEDLPLADASLDVIFSSLAVQWSQHPTALLQEWRRVLKPGGRICLATLGPASLQQLRDSFAGLDQYQHVNRFFSADDWQQFAAAAKLDVSGCDERQRTVYYPDLKSLLQSLKAIGAHTVLQHGRPGLMGKRRWQQLQQAYEHYREADGLPLAYQLIFMELQREK